MQEEIKNAPSKKNFLDNLFEQASNYNQSIRFTFKDF